MKSNMVRHSLKLLDMINTKGKRNSNLKQDTKYIRERIVLQVFNINQFSFYYNTSFFLDNSQTAEIKKTKIHNSNLIAIKCSNELLKINMTIS